MTVQEDGRDFGALEEIAQVAVGGIQLIDLFVKLHVDRVKLFIERLQLLFGSLEFLIGRLHLLVDRMQFLITAAELLECRLVFFSKRLKLFLSA